MDDKQRALDNARRSLSCLRASLQRGGSCRAYLDDLRCQIESSHVTLEDLDLSKDEYEGFPRKVDVEKARHWLVVYCLGSRLHKNLYDVKRWIDEGKVTYEELGLTEKEFLSLYGYSEGAPIPFVDKIVRR